MSSRCSARPLWLLLDKLVRRDLAGMFDGREALGGIAATGTGIVLDVSAVFSDKALLRLVMLAAISVLQACYLVGDASDEWSVPRRFFVVDECWSLLGQDEAARFLQENWKLARARGVANVAVCHRVTDLGAQANSDVRDLEDRRRSHRRHPDPGRLPHLLPRPRRDAALARALFPRGRDALSPAEGDRPLASPRTFGVRPPRPQPLRGDLHRHRREVVRMTPARGDEFDGTARLPKDAVGLGIALVGFALAILAADVARGVALGIHGGGFGLLSVGSSARFLVQSLTRPGALDPLTARRGASLDAPVYWTVFGVLLALGIVASGFLLRAVGRGATASDGFASRAELTAVAGVEAAKRQAAITRPSLAPKELTQQQVGYPLGVSRRPRGVELVASWETSLELVAPPGAGKTLRVLARILRQHPGPCLATATKPDLYEVSAKARERLGPVFALDPDGLAPAAKPLRWSPVVGCEDSAVAERRAGALVAAAGEAGDLRSASFFRRSAITVLAAYLHAAALDGATIADVVTWAGSPSDPAPLRILSEHLDGRVDWGARLHQHTSGAAETTSGVMRSVDLALAPFQHDEVLERCAVDAEHSFDIAAALSCPTTIYALAKDRGSASVGAGPLDHRVLRRAHRRGGT